MFYRVFRIAYQRVENASTFEKNVRFIAPFIQLFIVIPRFESVLFRRRYRNHSAIDAAISRAIAFIGFVHQKI